MEGEGSVRAKVKAFKDRLMAEDRVLVHRVESSATVNGTELKPTPVVYITDLKDFVFSYLNYLSE